MSILLLAPFLPFPQRFLGLFSGQIWPIPLYQLFLFPEVVQHKYGIITYFSWTKKHNSTLRGDELLRATFLFFFLILSDYTHKKVILIFLMHFDYLLKFQISVYVLVMFYTGF